jgi:hypothetical protein
MKQIPISALQAKASYRPPGYLDDVMASGRVVGDMLLVSRAVWASLCAKYRGPQPLNKWPDWAQRLALLRVLGETGIGDTTARIIGPIGGDAYRAWYRATFGRTCGCQERQEQLNTTYPYEILS